MADDDHRATLLGGTFHHLEAPFAKLGVANCKDLINDQNLRLQIRGYCKSQSYPHSRRIEVHRSVDECFASSQVQNLIELPVDLGPLHPKDCTVQIDVLATCQLRMEARAHFQQGAQ